VIMGATLAWPAMAMLVLGFVVLTGLVVALGSSSTARYEFERNAAGDGQRPTVRASATHPAGRRSRNLRRPARVMGAPARVHAVDVVVRPAPAPAPATADPCWWLVDESSQVVAGPFADRIDADWVCWSDDLAAIAVFGLLRPDGRVAPRNSPGDREFLEELGDQLDRLPDDWDELLTDTDPLTTLVVEVAAALVEAGMALYDAPAGSAAGGVCLVPELASGGVLVSWRAHDRMSLHQLRGAAANATVQQSMNAAVAEVLWNLGFVVEPYGTTGTSLVTALR
jgi:hypothetical protein